MQLNGLSRADIAQRLGVSSQYVSRILVGNITHSLKSIAEMEDAQVVQYDFSQLPETKMVADETEIIY